jgi:hypothetical protein
LSFIFVADQLLNSRDSTIKLNLEELKELDSLIANGFDDWVDLAPDHWKVDRFLTRNSPVVVTSCFGQNAQTALSANKEQEALNWEGDRDYSKVAYLTVAIATSIKYALYLLPFLQVFLGGKVLITLLFYSLFPLGAQRFTNGFPSLFIKS